ncbi:CBS domain-containing protein [Bacillus sp. FJAT-42376]|uniref:cyclic-di-AMP-binding protein CbpB n=1 Tax=Bacillus sp. FJAT-42376 TaxID=2014076 RepID=UPI000F4E1290|nr:cyclic-di-AMP-binding protein CbpB [Bacillus sp. FJAT-42376]AZB42633.1 CBS domain-containing protein [Bacillus sp. FJAT-42376]
MITLRAEEMIEISIKDLMIPGDKVAHVQLGNNLEHALMVLTRTGYTAIPVLDSSYKLHGLVGTNMIIDSIMGLERIEAERLVDIKVSEVMNRNIPRLKISDSPARGLELVVDHPFVCVEDQDGFFEGIFTRREILKQLDRHVKRLNRG